MIKYVTVYTYFAKITRNRWQVTYVSYRWHFKERKSCKYCTGIPLTQVVIDLWLKTWKILILAHFNCNFTTMISTWVKLRFVSSSEHFWPDPLDTLSYSVSQKKKKMVHMESAILIYNCSIFSTAFYMISKIIKWTVCFIKFAFVNFEICFINH